MRNTLCKFSAFLMLSVVSSCALSAAELATLPAANGSPSQAQARVIVKFKPGARTLQMQALSTRETVQPTSSEILQHRAQTLGSRHGLALSSGRGISDRMQVFTGQGLDSATLARKLAADKDVEYVLVDQRRKKSVVPNDPLFAPVSGASPASGQWYLKNATAPFSSASTDLVSSINAPGAWDVTTGSSSVVVAVLDTGVRFDHVDMVGKILPGYDMVSSSSISLDGSARDPDASDPGDSVSTGDTLTSQFDDCETQDSSWHGTQVAGLIAAASHNGIGMTGVAWESKILPVRVLGKCFGYDSDIIAGMRWAVGLTVTGVPTNTTPAQVLNLSLGGASSCNSAYSDVIAEITAAGAVVVAAAGNDSGQAVDVPANCPGVIGVTALRHLGTKVGFANLGSELTIAAPGGNCVTLSECLYPILSATNTGTSMPVLGSAGSTYTDSVNYGVGTSFSAPLVAGTVALMLSANPNLTPVQIISLLQSTARAFPSQGAANDTPSCVAPSKGLAQDECYCTTSTCGAGMLDANAAVRAASALATPSNGPLTARITVLPSLPSPGQSVTLSSARTLVDVGRTVVSTQWTLLDGGGIVSGFAGSDTSETAQLVPTSVGSFSVRLRVIDDLATESTSDVTVNVDTLSVQSTASTENAVTGETVTFSVSDLQLSTGRTLAAYAWSLLDGAGAIQSLNGDLTASSITVRPTSAGVFSVRLTASDDLGKTAISDLQVSVTGDTITDSGSGGGAVSAGWLLGLLLATLSLSWGRKTHARQP